MKFICLNILRKIWYLIAVVAIFMALMVTLARVLTPLFNLNRGSIEHWATQVLGVPVRMDRVVAWWDGFRPDIKFVNVRILDSSGTITRLQVKELRIDVNVLGSIMHGRIQPDEIEISGANLVVHQSEDQSLHINGLMNQKINLNQATDSINNTELADWVSAQKYLAFKDIAIDFYPAHGDVLLIKLKRLLLINSEKQHFISGSLSLFSHEESALHFASVINGNLDSIKTTQITLYANLENYPLSQFVYKPTFYGNQLSQGLFDGEIWLDYQDNQVQSFQSLFHLSQAKILSTTKQEQPLIINAASGNIFWQRQMTGWQFSGDNVNLETENKVWPENKFNLIVTKDKQNLAEQKFWIHYLNLHDIQQLLLSGSFSLPSTLRELAKALDLKGSVTDFFISHHGNASEDKGFRCVSQFSNVSFNHWRDVPGVDGLTGYLDVSSKRGEVKLNSANVTLDFGSLFPNTLLADRLSGHIVWHQLIDHDWVIRAKELNAINQFIALYGNAGVLLPHDNNGPIVSVLAGFDFNDTSQAPHYLPVGIIGKPVVNWLNQAFPSGDGGSGTVILRGRIHHFPFDHHEGTFIIDTQIRKMQFHFAPGWPNAQNVVAELIFNGRSMLSQATAGQIYNAHLNFFNASIPYMGHDKPNHLLLNGGITGDASDLLRYLNNSPLKKSVGESIQELQMHGKTDVNLNLDVPLSDPEKTDVKGRAQFYDAMLNLPSWGISGKQFNGKLRFTDTSLASENLTLNLFGEPATLSINTVSKNEGRSPMTQVSFAGHLLFSTLLKHFQLPEFEDIHGDLGYQGELLLHSAKEDKQQNQLHVTSTLQGLEIDMPVPFKKASDETLPATLDYWFNGDNSSLLKINLKDQFDGQFLFNHVNKRLVFTEGSVLFGNGVSTLTKQLQGLAVTINLPTLDWQSWLAYIQMKMKSQGSKIKTEVVDELKQIVKLVEFNIKDITLYQQPMHDAKFLLTPNQSGWRLGVSSLRIAGNVLVPEDYKKSGISGHFSRLYLHAIEGLGSSEINPGDILPLSLSINNFQYGGMYLGNVNVETHSISNGLILNSLQVVSPIFSCSLSGSWQQQPEGSDTSHLFGKVSSSDVYQLLKSFRFNSSVIVKKGSGKFNFSWPGPLYQLKIAEIKGGLSLNFGGGQVVDIGPSASQQLNMGRLLTLLSIHRLIHLDYADFAKQGYNFDAMQGDFLLNHGSISTKNLSLVGSTADIAIRGAFNIVNQTMNFELAVLPHVTASLPIVVGVINPIAGAITWVAEKLFSNTVGKKMIVYKYTVTGGWKKPIIVKH